MLKEIINDFNINQFIRFFREKNRAFAPRQEELIYYDDENFKNGLKLGEIKFVDAEELIICAFEVMQSLTERSGKKSQYEKAKKILKETQYDTGIFIFYDQNGNFRFSLIYANYFGTKRDWSNFRRFTYFVSKEFTNKTFLQRIGDGDFSSLEKIKDAFSVEKVTKEFYRDISYWYFWTVQKAKFPEDAEKEDNGRNIAIIRLITRLIFIWFMRERKLIPGNLFDYQKIKQILKDISPGKTTYYKAILQNLFFATLNTKERKYRFQITGWKNSSYMDHGVYRYQDYFINSAEALKIFKEIPFLNGGLFDCLDRRESKEGKNIEVRIDGFSDKDVGLKFPNFLFFSGETNADLNKDFGTKNKKYKVQGLINILSAYNFTIDENDPNDQEVALDPELLGKVFENLLASFNPETSSTARKATGSYYTPREIVDYMVTQSLKEYLKTHLSQRDGYPNDVEKLDKKLDELFTAGNENNPFDERDTKNIVKLIDALRIVDPAVGSGAFPMGVLNKLVFILSKLDPENSLWKETQINAVEKSVTDPVLKNKLKEHITYQFEEKNLDYGRKLYLIQKCIYGVDIQQIAVEIAKLRFFISLLVDEKIDKSKDNWGIEALPNLDFKIMQGNSLISEFMGINFDADENENNNSLLFEDETDQLIKIFQEKKNQFQNESDKHRKDKLIEDIEDLIIQIFEIKLQKQKASYFSKLKSIKEYGLRFSNEKNRNDYINNEKEKLYKITGFNIDEMEKQLREFSSGNKTKPFFLWKLYFAEVFQGENHGFDIVIANPPYIDSKRLKYISESLTKFKTFVGTADLYVYFYETGVNLLKRYGILSYITSNKWIRSEYGRNLRSFFLKNTNPLFLIDFGTNRVFDATVDSNILFVQNTENKDNFKICSILEKINESDFTNYLSKNFVSSPNFTDDTWLLSTGEKNILKEKIEKNGIPLKDWNITILRGILTGLNDAFIIDNQTKEDLIKQDKKNAEIIKPLLRGKEIYKYQYKWTNLWLINTHNGIKEKKINPINVKKDYPIIYKYLEQFLPEIKKRQDQGNHWSNLRNCAYLEEFEKEKIIWQGVAKRIEFCYDTNNFYNDVTTFFMTGENLKFLLSVFNSKFFEYTLLNIYLEGDTFKSKNQILKNFPIPKISEIQQQPFITKVDKILSITKSEDYSDNPEKQAKVKELGNEIDKLVYELYGLTEEEIIIVENI